MSNFNILVVDDESGIRRLIKDFLVRENMNVIEAVDGNDALLKFYDNEKTLNLIILDVMLPYIDGFTVLNKIRETSSVPIIMLTAKAEEESQILGFDSGANDYVTKPFSPLVLISRMKRFLKESKFTDILINNMSIDTSKRKVLIDDEEVYLTYKEYELLLYLAENIDNAVSREDILTKIWAGKDGDTRSVDTHIKQLRAKLSNAKVDIQTVRGFGYMIIGAGVDE